MTNHKELTTEDRAKCFALYLGYPVGSEIEAIHPYGETPDEKVRGYLTGIHGEYGVEFAIIESSGATAEEPAYQDYDKCQLILSDLADITDEDAVEVAKLVAKGMCTNETKFERHGNGSYWCYVKLINTNAEVRIWFESMKLTFCNVYDHSVTTLDGNFLEAYDFLRSRSYALPWMGQSLFDLGIAERKQR